MNLELTPARRKALYQLFALLGILLGATVVGFSAADAGQPTALKVALAVYAFLIGPAGLGLAASKVKDA